MWISDQEYGQIKRALPIPCVDLLISNEKGEILLVKRKNEPAKNEWWFPGGRVLHGEHRNKAAKRKAKEECGIIAGQLVEWKTVDIFLQDNEEKYSTHGISTIFLLSTVHAEVVLDEQSSQYAWKSIEQWNQNVLSDFMIDILEEFSNYKK